MHLESRQGEGRCPNYVDPCYLPGRRKWSFWLVGPALAIAAVRRINQQMENFTIIISDTKMNLNEKQNKTAALPPTS